MNAALDSPLEALAFNYLTYGFLTAVNNIWAWIAVVTAAVSFWRIRSPDAAASTSTSTSTSTSSAAPAPPIVAEITPARASCVVLERQGSTKMKFSLYYKEETEEEVDSRGDDDGSESEEHGGGAAAAATSLVFDAWSGDSIALRMGDIGLYRWQDRTVLDGNVVRLWEERRRKHAAAPLVAGGVAW